jgi:energy-coupling factor transport system ATP-binding protein
MSNHARNARPLTPVEVATAGALSGLAVTFGLIAAVTPVFQLLFQVATAVPLAMASLKLRPRASVAAFASTVLLAIAVGGFATAGRSFQAALIGLIIGHLHKKHASWASVSAVAAGLGVVWGVGTGVAFLVLSDLRTLGLESIRKSLDGLLNLIAHIPHSGGFVDAGHRLGQWFVDWWWIWIPLTRFIGVAFLVLAARWLLGAILRRITLDPGWDPLLDAPTLAGTDAGETAAASSPLPLTLTDAAFTYPGTDHPALRGVTLSFERPEFTVIVGHNGSGKSTLALLLAGAEPDSGTRQGGGLLGAVGGTALVGQRSELLVLGQSVAEDVTWGMSAQQSADLDLDELLERVGLAGLADADPRSLSGGQLQRLALAGALARSPRLLISDESTAMIDRDGRAEILDLLASLPARGIAVVHITHDPAESARADRVITIRSGRILSDTRADTNPSFTDEAAASPTQRHTSPATPRGTSQLEGGIDRESAADDATPASSLNAEGERIWGSPDHINTEHLWADRVAHTYDLGTPWEKPVLRDVSLILDPGQAMLITGDNGSGKTTLSRILTGLLLPTWGAVTLGGKPMERRVGDVALSMQFARLQLQRPSVRTDILAAAGHGPLVGSGVGRRKNALSREEGDRIVADAMSLVGLDPALASNGIDDLSGGQMRRVALAGLLASNPRVLILDEPMAGLDIESRELLISVLDERRHAGLSILVISHDLEGMDDLCDTHRHLREGVLA